MDLFRLAVILETIGQIDRDLDLAREQAATHTFSAARASAATPEEQAALRDHLRTLARAQVRLGFVREHVAEPDPPAVSLDSRETLLRARTSVVLDRLAVLSDLGEQVAELGELFVGRLHTLDVLIAHVVDGLGRANARWRQVLRRLVEHVDLEEGCERESLYRVALDQAEHAFDQIGRDRDLAHFLRVGARSGNIGLRGACREIAAMVRAEIGPRGVGLPGAS